MLNSNRLACCVQVYSWGDNTFGQTGISGEDEGVVPYPARVKALAHVVVTQIACGANHTLALTAGVLCPLTNFLLPLTAPINRLYPSLIINQFYLKLLSGNLNTQYCI